MTSRYSVNYQVKSHKRDHFIEFIKSLLLTPFVLTTAHPSESKAESFISVFSHVESLLDEHRQHQDQNTVCHSRLYRFVPALGTFFTRLPLAEAFQMVDKRYSISARRHIPPSFNDIRRILNTAQVISLKNTLKLITFDGDVTLYEDGDNLDANSPVVALLVKLLSMGFHVAIVTAAGYTDSQRYEQRLSGLLQTLKAVDEFGNFAKRLFVVGGECNYLLNVKCPDFTLSYLPVPSHDLDLKDDVVDSLLDIAQDELLKCVNALHLSAKIIRKERAVGLISASPSTIGLSNQKNIPYKIEREQLDECVVSTQERIRWEFDKLEQKCPPFCAFNGGRDVWIDVGNKLIGVQLLQKILGCKPEETLHVGDQFLSTGNDIATRSACCTVWITSPEETCLILDQLISLLIKDQS